MDKIKQLWAEAVKQFNDMKKIFIEFWRGVKHFRMPCEKAHSMWKLAEEKMGLGATILYLIILAVITTIDGFWGGLILTIWIGFIIAAFLGQLTKEDEKLHILVRTSDAHDDEPEGIQIVDDEEKSADPDTGVKLVFSIVDEDEKKDEK